MEGAFLLAVQAVRIDGLTQVMALFSSLGVSGFVWVVSALLLLIFPQRRQTGLILLVSLVLSFILCTLVSHVVARPYPTQSVTGLIAVVGVSHAGYCFPSLHAVFCAAAVTVLLRSQSPALGSAGLVVAVCICLARLYLGVNYPSDLVVGAVMGFVIGFVCVTVIGRVLDAVGTNMQPRQHARKQVNSKRGRHSL